VVSDSTTPIPEVWSLDCALILARYSCIEGVKVCG
jgi:hypothetical protein